MVCRGGEFGDCTRLAMAYIGEEPEVGKGRDLGDLGEE